MVAMQIYPDVCQWLGNWQVLKFLKFLRMQTLQLYNIYKILLSFTHHSYAEEDK